jgi:hypothetical protein
MVRASSAVRAGACSDAFEIVEFAAGRAVSPSATKTCQSAFVIPKAVRSSSLECVPRPFPPGNQWPGAHLLLTLVADAVLVALAARNAARAVAQWCARRASSSSSRARRHCTLARAHKWGSFGDGRRPSLHRCAGVQVIDDATRLTEAPRGLRDQATEQLLLCPAVLSSTPAHSAAGTLHRIVPAPRIVGAGRWEGWSKAGLARTEQGDAGSLI